MPTVLRFQGFDIRIYSNDHEPAHVHVVKGEGEVKIHLGSTEPGREEAPSLVRVWAMGRKDAAQALELVSARQELLLSEWSRIHGA